MDLDSNDLLDDDDTIPDLLPEDDEISYSRYAEETSAAG
jgi:hypothetical protein